MPWQTILQEIGRIWLVSSWMMSLTFIIWIKTDNKLELPKSEATLIIILMSITHAILKVVVPQIAFIFIILLLIMVSIILFNLNIFRAFKSIIKLIFVILFTETVLYILLFKVLNIQANPNDNIFWIVSSVSTLLSVVAIKRKELFKVERILLGSTPNKHQKTRKTGNC